MPNFDAGHYFLTALAPIRADAILRDGQSHSHRHLIKEMLARLPTGERTVASRDQDNPFARATRTHFARVFVLDDVVFNGRTSGGTLLETIFRVDPLVPQPVDRLTTPFLVFAADFDAASGDDAELRSYAAELWDTMRDELTAVLQHCHGFAGVTGPEEFFHYLKRCQVETTMPFNDYWSVMPKLPSFDLAPYLAAAVGAVVVAIIAAFWGHSGWPLLVGVIVIAAVAAWGVRDVMEAARRPLPKSPPAAPQPDLPTVLKALYLQREFTAFAIEAQGLRAGGDQALHEAFGAFLAANAPDNLTAPTQPPGVIGVAT